MHVISQNPAEVLIQLANQFSEFNKKFDGFQATVLSRFEGIEQRVANVEKQLADIRAVPKAEPIPAVMEILNTPAAASEVKPVVTKRVNDVKEKQLGKKHKPAPKPKLPAGEIVKIQNAEISDEEIEICLPVRQQFVPLKNFGNTCYVNSVVHLLFSMPAFEKLLLESKHEQSQTLTALKELHIAYKILNSKNLEEKLKQMVAKIVEVIPDFKKETSQKDAPTVLTHLLDVLGYKLNMKKVKTGNHPSRGAVTETTDVVATTLFLGIKGQTDLPTMIASSFKPEVTKPWKMPKQKAMDTYTKEYKFATAPNMIFFNIDRCSFDSVKMMTVKDTSSIPFCKELDLTQHMFDDDAKALYQLAGAVMHLGNGRGGHYCAYLPCGGKWHRVSSEKIEPMQDLEENTARGSEIAIVLAYERV